MINEIYIFFFSFLLTFLSVPFIIQQNKKLVANKQINLSIKAKSKSRIGGISLFLSFLISLVFIIYNQNPSQEEIYFLLFVFLGSALSFLLGLIDDLFNIAYITRLFGQIFIATLTWLGGIGIFKINFSTFPNESSTLSLPIVFSFIFTLIWIVGIMNSINWIDGLDGLAAGVVLIISLGFVLNDIFLDDIPQLLSISLSGICLAFLRYNFYKSKIFMGDGGSYFLGYLLSILCCNIYQNKDINQIYSSNFYVFPAVLLMSVPLFDMTFVILKRIISKRSPFLGDKNHIHHRILRKGFNHKNSVLIIYLITLISTLSVILLPK